MGVQVNGPKIIFTIPIFGGIHVTESIVNMWIIMAVIVTVCIWLTRGLKVVPTSKKQLVAEKLVDMLYSLVRNTMGERNMRFAPYIGTLFTMSIVGSLSSLLTLRPYTADYSVVLSWALTTFILVHGTNIYCNGIKGWAKGFVEPVPFLLPLNIISEVASPVSMSFRHFGNIAAGTIITKLVYAGLAAASYALLSWIPNAFLASIPILQLGIPAVLSIYFDLFSSFLQAYIICMLTMVFISNTNNT